MTQTPDAATPEGGTHVPAAASPPAELSPVGADRVLDALLSRLRQLMGADVTVLLAVDQGVLRVAASLGLSADAVADASQPVGHGFAGTIAATCAPGVISDSRQLGDDGLPWVAEGVTALVGVPLLVGERVLGVAVVGSRSDRAFGDPDIELLTAAAEHAAWAIDNGLLLGPDGGPPASTTTATERLRRLQAMSQELLSELSVDGVIATVVERGLSLIGANAGGVWERDEEAGELALRGIVG
ncbi:MAG TPA: GAF domain-containing protein, partial [Mycobacteriales bacterium]|nr:GAF domain-containing protein [Mycobacteriales bacterium]